MFQGLWPDSPSLDIPTRKPGASGGNMDMQPFRLTAADSPDVLTEIPSTVKSMEWWLMPWAPQQGQIHPAPVAPLGAASRKPPPPGLSGGGQALRPSPLQTFHGPGWTLK